MHLAPQICSLCVFLLLFTPVFSLGFYCSLELQATSVCVLCFLSVLFPYLWPHWIFAFVSSLLVFWFLFRGLKPTSGLDISTLELHLGYQYLSLVSGSTTSVSILFSLLPALLGLTPCPLTHTVHIRPAKSMT